jgi:hypothetical protein
MRIPPTATLRPNLRSARIVDGRSWIAGLVICWLLVGSALPASAAVYLDDAVIDDTTNIPTLAFPPWTGMGRVLHLTQSPNGFVVVEVNRIGSTANFEFIYQSIAGAYGLCQVSSGEELTYLNLASKSGLGGWGGGNTLTLNPGQEAYIGYWSQRNGKPVAPPEANDIYGWARVTNTAGNLVLISSASADTGIIVGTTQAIPEPGPALLASAASLLLIRRSRDRGSMITNGRTGNCHLSQSKTCPGVASRRRVINRQSLPLLTAHFPLSLPGIAQRRRGTFLPLHPRHHRRSSPFQLLRISAFQHLPQCPPRVPTPRQPRLHRLSSNGLPNQNLSRRSNAKTDAKCLLFGTDPVAVTWD